MCPMIEFEVVAMGDEMVQAQHKLELRAAIPRRCHEYDADGTPSSNGLCQMSIAYLGLLIFEPRKTQRHICNAKHHRTVLLVGKTKRILLEDIDASSSPR